MITETYELALDRRCTVCGAEMQNRDEVFVDIEFGHDVGKPLLIVRAFHAEHMQPEEAAA